MNDVRIQEIQALLPRGMVPDWVRLGSRLVRMLRDQRHPDTHNAILDRLLAQARASVALREERRLQIPRVAYPPELPITSRRDDIVAAIRAHQVVVIAGETGSGKTTQIPKMCLEAGLGIEAKIGCTQPRRVAALSISQRIADELGVIWGREVGCKIRFDDQTSNQTYIKLMTDGILLAETQGDPLLSEYNAIIIDEAHERSLNIDFLLGYLKGLLVKRPELKLIITSATIDTQAFSAAFDNAPIIEVSGRLYPVHVVYEPFDVASEERGDMTYIDAAVRAAEGVLCEPGNGDVLIFMPGERDIRETSDLLEGRFGREAEIIPLFGRLSAGDQQRVFAPADRRKIIIATNIAETSLTLPGIRYVIDSGLARMSRYNPRTRTQRLPVEEISQSSANQRKGRSGRVQDGICIRLYSEENFAERPAFTQPEIQRANLAEVILRMKAFHLGEIETFPFVNPPMPAAIQAGYSLLQELGALDESRGLTDMGRDLARLPIDPTLGRMLLQSQQEHATRELLIIAAGLSIQDPRERPLDQKEAAAAAHKRWSDPQSDFLTLLKIWNAVHDQWETMRSQGQRRKFCKANFLSYLRFKEWQDLYAQLHSALEDLRSVDLNESNAAYDAIHRSILAGLLGHVAVRKERNTYIGMGNRQVAIFPGSSLFDKQEKPRKPANFAAAAPRPASIQQPAWIVAGEMVETSQLFARTVAGIDPLWIIQLAPHLCKVTHQNPRWDVKAGNVLVDEKTTFNGMELRQRKVAYGNVAPLEATEIFIRSALVEEDLLPLNRRGSDEDDDGEDEVRVLVRAAAARPALPAQYSFIEHNRQVRHKIETWQTRVRRHDLKGVDQVLFDFYTAHLKNVSSVPELNRWLREEGNGEMLCLKEIELTGGLDMNYDVGAFPDAVPLGGQPVALSYAYAPGEEQDGVTVKLGFSLAQTISQASVEWAVPGLREAQIGELLRALPKAIRRELMPFPPKVAEIARELRPVGDSLKKDLAQFIRQHYGVKVSMDSWSTDAIPPHLRPRVEVVDNNQKPMASGRDLNELRQRLEKAKAEPTGENPAWAQFALNWEQFGLTAWTFGDLPERITVSETGTMPLYAWPGIQEEERHVSLRLFRSQAGARRASLAGCRRLLSIALQKDLAWLHKDMRALSRFAPMTAGWLTAEELAEAAFESLLGYLLPAEMFPALSETAFQAALERARELLPGLSAQMGDRLDLIFKLRQDICLRCKVTAPVAPTKSRVVSDFRRLGSLVAAPPLTNRWMVELNLLLPASFLKIVPYGQLPQLPRYLKALWVRMERATLNPVKDSDRSRQLAPYQEALQRFTVQPPSSPDGPQRLNEFRWMVEEFKVSLFAQELGTAFPVSAQRLDQQLRLIS